MLKHHRIYNARFEIYQKQEDMSFKHEKTIEIKNPITCYLNISIDSAGSANMGVFQFINLSPEVRANLWQDVYSVGDKRISLTFQAGYGYPDEGADKYILPMVFFGEVKECTSTKDGKSTEWVTNVQAFEGGYFYEYGFCNSTLVKGTEFIDLVNHLLESDNNTQIGSITPDIKPLARNKTFIGQTMDLLGREYGGYEVFIDKGKLNVLDANDVLPSELLALTAESGLLGSPKRSSTQVIVDLLFEPQVRCGQEISLKSDSLPQFNQAYKVMSVKHSGVISERESGNLYTTLALFALDVTKKRVVEQAKPSTYTGETTSIWDKPLLSFKKTESFGWRIHPITKQKQFHSGVDLGAREGEPIYAPADGKVSFVGMRGGYGNCVTLNNGVLDNITLTSLFGHMRSWAVEMGQQVYKGQTILGYVGSTGRSTGPHLHFEIMENGKPINPSKYVGTL